MMDDSGSHWPTYLPRSRDQYHALGMVTGMFSWLEYRLLGLFLTFTGFDDIHKFLFARLRDNTLRIDILHRALAAKAQRRRRVLLSLLWDMCREQKHNRPRKA